MGDEVVDGLVEIERESLLIGLKGLQGMELGVDETAGHEVAEAACDPLRNDLRAACQVHEYLAGRGLAQHVPVPTPERRTTEHGTGVGTFGQPSHAADVQ